MWPAGMNEVEAVQHLITLVGYRIHKQAMQLSFYKASKVLDDTRPDDSEELVRALRGLDVKRRLHKLAVRLPKAEADFLRRLAEHEEVWSLIGVRGAAHQVARCLGLSYVNYRQLLHRIAKRGQPQSASQNSRPRSVS